MIIKSWIIPTIKGSAPVHLPRFSQPCPPSKSAYNTQSLLEYYLTNTPINVYIDTCSLLHKESIELLDNVEEVFARYNQTLYVFDSVYNEIESVGHKNLKVRSIAKNTKRKLFHMQRKGIVQFIEGPNDTFSDVNFISKFVSDISNNNVLLISQDYNLTELALSLKHTLYPCICSRYDVYAAKVTQNGLININISEKIFNW